MCVQIYTANIPKKEREKKTHHEQQFDRLAFSTVENAWKMFGCVRAFGSMIETRNLDWGRPWRFFHYYIQWRFFPKNVLNDQTKWMIHPTDNHGGISHEASYTRNYIKNVWEKMLIKYIGKNQVVMFC